MAQWHKGSIAKMNYIFLLESCVYAFVPLCLCAIQLRRKSKKSYSGMKDLFKFAEIKIS
jgi:hypothetical protein